MESVTQVQILGKAFCADALRKGMSPSLVSLAKGEILRQTGLFGFGKETNLRERKLCI